MRDEHYHGIHTVMVVDTKSSSHRCLRSRNSMSLGVPETILGTRPNSRFHLRTPAQNPMPPPGQGHPFPGDMSAELTSDRSTATESVELDLRGSLASAGACTEILRTRSRRISSGVAAAARIAARRRAAVIVRGPRPCAGRRECARPRPETSGRRSVASRETGRERWRRPGRARGRP